MAAIQSVIEEHSTANLPLIATDSLQRFCAGCEEFCKVQHEQTVAGNPSPSELEENRQGLWWAIRLAQVLFSLVDDPEFPDKVLRDKLEHQLWKLKEYWKLLYNLPTGAEAEKLRAEMAEIFPDEPRA